MKSNLNSWRPLAQRRAGQAGLAGRIPPPTLAEPAGRNVALAYQLHFATHVNPAQQVGFWFLMGYLFLATSRLPEFYAPGLHLPLILACCGLVLAVVGGGLVRLMRSALGRWFAGLTFCLGASIPFSVWKGGSFEVFTQEWLKSVLVFVMLAALIRTSRHALIAMGVIAWASLALIILTYLHGVAGPEGRLMLPIGQYSNANDLATGLLMGILFWWFMVANPAHSIFARVFGLGVLGAALPALVKTGSRAAMIVVIVALPMLLLQRSLANRLKLFTAGAVLVAVAVTALPGYLRDRYLTFLAPPDSEELGRPMTAEEQAIFESAVGSTQSRMELLKDSIRFTLQHPLLGVGLGMFAVAESDDALLQGNRGLWRGTHNTYTQVSSEAGVPALAMLLAILVSAFRMLKTMQGANAKSHHPYKQHNAAAAAMLRAFLLATSVGLLFMHVAYSPMIPTFIGVVFGLAASTMDEIKAGEGTAATLDSTGAAQWAASAPRRPARDPRAGYPRAV